MFSDSGMIPLLLGVGIGIKHLLESELESESDFLLQSRIGIDNIRNCASLVILDLI